MVRELKQKNDRLSPVDQIFKNEQDVAYQQADGTCFAGQYKRCLSVVERLNAQISLQIKVFNRLGKIHDHRASTPSYIRIQLKMDRCRTTLLNGRLCT